MVVNVVVGVVVAAEEKGALIRQHSEHESARLYIDSSTLENMNVLDSIDSSTFQNMNVLDSIDNSTFQNMNVLDCIDSSTLENINFLTLLIAFH